MEDEKVHDILVNMKETKSAADESAAQRGEA